MFAVVLLSTLAVPFAPVLSEPGADGWTIGRGAYFSVVDFSDDAGLPAGGLRIEFRPADGGYTATLTEQTNSRWGLNTALPFQPEGARWCWRAYHRNVLGEEGPPSAEQCFRTDWTPPISPRVDAGTLVSTGRVVLPYSPGSDALSGVQGYFLRVSPVGLDDFSSFNLDLSLANPFETYLGEGAWEVWLEARDNAWNLPDLPLGPKPVVVVMADRSLPQPAPPVFEQTVTNGYGTTITWDAGIPNAEFWVVSFCNLDAGCVWRDGINGRPASRSPEAWVQLEDEGSMVARVAVVRGGVVGPWSAPSQAVKLDRTAPAAPQGLSLVPLAARTGPLTLSWSPVPDDFVGPVSVVVEETAADGGIASFMVDAGSSMVSLSRGDGRWRYRALARDLAQNESDWTAAVTATLDSTGPSAQPPLVTASAADGGARVTITWSTPVDALSTVTSIDLQERLEDGGSSVVSVSGNATQRFVGPGRWRWAIRGTDALGNVGAFSAESAPVDVGAVVGVGPSIATDALTLQCGRPAVVQLMGAGDAPRVWQLINGPMGAAVSPDGVFTWVVPERTRGTQTVTVSLTNAVGTVEEEIQVTVTCADAGVESGRDASVEMDAGVDAGAVDAGVADAGALDGGVERRELVVGCGCGASDDASGLLLALTLFAMRPTRRGTHRPSSG
ncbi:MAG: hypothetical protein GQE15_04800 [Archangiaceae bacterium]|nr:hypothetical protein [Archangiaceae bacterium]